MPGTVIEYLKEYGWDSFSERPMNNVDSLALCQLSYLKFDGLVPDVRKGRRWVILRQLKLHSHYGRMFTDVRYAEQNRALFEAMILSRRYSGLKLGCYINLTSKEWETQFSAVTFQLDDGTIYIAYRGTDETIVGWKEDFNMTFLSPVPGQIYSVKYLHLVMGGRRIPFYLGGHSKGGNFAVYAAMNCRPDIQRHIHKIYNMDGPGFRPEVLRSGRYERIAGRVVKILPHSSLIGILFEKNPRYRVVESKHFGLAQHNPYNWKVEGGEFKWAEDVHGRRKFMGRTLNEWLLSLEIEKLRLLVNTLYQAISASGAKDLIEFAADWKKNINVAIAALRKSDKHTKEMLKDAVRSLFSLAGTRLKDKISLKRQKSKKKSKIAVGQP